MSTQLVINRLNTHLVTLGRNSQPPLVGIKRRDERKGGMFARATFGGLFVFVALLVLLVLLVHGIAPRTGPTGHDTFLWGILHGILIIPDFIAKVIHPHVYAIYQTPNSGLGYDFGYVIGAAGVLGGGASVL